ncbi:MAG TPA: triose-phosphate isomerase [Deltaproteobacteria bacterium]|nr:triose-phosphate isomerase [Deltaproteobacteria bacterium]
MSDRKALIAGNWKMYKTCAEAVDEAKALVDLVQPMDDREIMIAPTYTALAQVSEVLKGSPVALGAQNMFWENEGAFTGEISAPMLISAGCSHVIIGHSERRQYFGETDDTVNKKIVTAFNHDLIPVFCIGESEQERDLNQTFSILDKQVTKGLSNLSSKDLETLIIAYEPIWAIGTGKTATTEQAQEAHRFIRSLIDKAFGSELAQSMRILYGGSVKPDNIDELMAMPDVDGALVGGASLKADSFSNIIKYNR